MTASRSTWKTTELHLIIGERTMNKAITYFLLLASLFFTADGVRSQNLLAARMSATEDAHTIYVKKVQDHVNNQWSYKKTLNNQFNMVQVGLILNEDGYVVEMSILKLSPDDTFNDSALKALVGMQPYPPIPDTLGGKKMEVQFTLMPNS